MCEYSRSRSFHYDLILQDQASGERSQDQWSSGLFLCHQNILSHLCNMLDESLSVMFYQVFQAGGCG